jgi:predicted nucleic acid-binding protein
MGGAARALHRGREGGSPPPRTRAASDAAGTPTVVRNFVYDAAILIAADRNERQVWDEHEARLEFGAIPLVPAPVVAQVSRSPRQALLRRFLAGCKIVAFGESDAHEAGRLMGVARTSDVVDAAVVTVAARHQAVILTGDRADMERLASVADGAVAVAEA